jgi:hypothetical protein
VFGFLTDCSPMLNDAEALRAHMRDEGYLYLPGLLDRGEVLAARRTMLERLAAESVLDDRYPIDDAIARPDLKMAFRGDLALKNLQMAKVVYGERMMGFFDFFLGGPARHFDYTWVRAVAPGFGTPPHMDIVYMGRGTKNLYTAWTPYGDIPLELGGLMVLERSHTHDRLNKGYGSKDVDMYCENRVGAGFTNMGGGGNISNGGWLSKNPITLRKRLGGRWLTTDYRAGDVLIFTVFNIHTSLDNNTNRIRLSSDTRYQLASEPVDERWIGEEPIGHGPAGKRGMIC